MTDREKFILISKLEFIDVEEDSNWFMSWDVCHFSDCKVFDDSRYGPYYRYSVELYNEKLTYKKMFKRGSWEFVSFEEIFENLPKETQEKIVFLLDLFV